jgi:hypothetical protein
MVSEELIKSQFEIAKLKFPKLHPPVRVGETWELIGAIDVIDNDGFLWDTYEIKIVVPNNYPEELFELQEIGNKIPKEANWHNDKSCCVSTNATIYSTLGEDLSLLNWLVKFAHPFFANYIVKKETGEYADGEFPHGIEGTVMGYEKLFDLKGAKAVYLKLKMICSVLQRGRNNQCFCGSRKKFKNCYLRSSSTHKNSGIPYSVLQNDLEDISTYLRRRKLLP